MTVIYMKCEVLTEVSMKFTGVWRRVFWEIFTEFLEECAASIFREE
jgi:hypothetical protein